MDIPRVKASVAKQYPTVTTDNDGAVGLGHVIDNDAYVSEGNGWYVRKPDLRWLRDDGEMYLETVESLGVPPTYKR